MSSIVLVTGVSGFIAKRLALDLLQGGYAVVGTLRSVAREAEVRTALGTNGLADPLQAKLRFVTADLTSDAGWDTAMTGVDAVMHTASPFPIVQPKNEDDLIRPAVDGTLRVLRAAQSAGISRVILTSSIEAVMHGRKSGPVTEADWSDTTARTASAYTRSKTLAERAAWDFVAQHPELQLTAINPGMVLGRPMDRHTGSSIGVLARLLSGKDPVVPDFRLPVTDLADVSAAHVAALRRPESAGRRFIVSDRFMSMPEMARLLKAAYPDRRIATRIAPRLLLRLLSLFDAEIRLILPWLDWHANLDNRAVRQDLGVTITPAEESIRAAAAFLVGNEARA